MEVTEVLLSAQSTDANVRSAAEASLKQFQEQNLPLFLLYLSKELSNEEKPSETRRLAGIILKNSLDAKDSIMKEQLCRQWIAVDPSMKGEIKETLLQTLMSPVSVARHASSQVVAKIASTEIPRREWHDLIARLLNNMSQQDPSAPLKQATLQTLGYVCEEINPQDLEQVQVDSILTAVVQGMSQNEQNVDVRLSAVRALYNALEFAQNNFENEMERNYIMKVILEAAVAKELDIRQAAFECLVSICSICYVFLDPYMDALYNLTANAIRVDAEPVALQAIEFWSSLCDDEILINEEYGDDNNPNLYFIKKSLSALVPLLLETLLKQEEDEDEDEDDTVWNLSMAGGTCLGLVARTVGDDVVPLVMPFIESNISHSDWHNREAATFAFGSILEGPSCENLSVLVEVGFEFLLNAMKDQNVHIKSTTAWTLGRIFEFMHSPSSSISVVNASNLPRIVSVLLDSMKDTSNVADKVCGTIFNLALGYEGNVTESSLLSPYLNDIISSLLFAADRKDSTSSRLRGSAYETLNQIVRSSNISDTAAITVQLLYEIMRRLAQTVKFQITSQNDREKQADIQALLCGVLHVIVQKLSSSVATKPRVCQVGDGLMLLFLRVFGCQSSTVHEEAMLAIGALAYATGPQFEKYMPELYKYLETGLQNFKEYQVCVISVGVIGDLCRALETKILPFCDGIMTHLLNHLSNPLLHRSVKPPIFICFGDIALAIGENFDKYLLYVMPMLKGAEDMCSSLDPRDEDLFDYGNQLRRSIFEAYSGILQGFKRSNALVLLPYAANLFYFIEAISRDKARDDVVTKAAIAALGDLADTLGSDMKSFFQGCTFHSQLLGECFASEDDMIRNAASWTEGMLNRVLVS